MAAHWALKRTVPDTNHPFGSLSRASEQIAKYVRYLALTRSADRQFVDGVLERRRR